MRSMGVIATLTAAMSIAVLVASPTLAQDSALDRAVDSLGGAAALQALDGFVVEATGTRATVDEGRVPGGPLTEGMLPYSSRNLSSRMRHHDQGITDSMASPWAG